MANTQADGERQRAFIVWSALERASDHISPGHPAELHIRRALAAAEIYWKTLAVPPTDALEGQRAER